METNKHDANTLRLRVIYLLAGWVIFMFIEYLSITLLNNYLIHHPYLLEKLGLTSSSVPGFYLLAHACSPLLLIGILVFSNWICLRFLETWGLFIIFMSITVLESSVLGSLATDRSISPDPTQDFLFSSMFWWSMFSICQIFIYLPVFTILYFIWIHCLKMRKSFAPLFLKVRVFLYCSNLFLIFGIVCFIFIITLCIA